MRYACDNIYSVQHEEQYYNRPSRRKAMALSMFECQNYYNLNNSMKPSLSSYYILTQLLKKNSPPLMGKKFILVFQIACFWTQA